MEMSNIDYKFFKHEFELFKKEIKELVDKVISRFDQELSQKVNKENMELKLKAFNKDITSNRAIINSLREHDKNIMSRINKIEKEKLNSQTIRRAAIVIGTALSIVATFSVAFFR